MMQNLVLAALYNISYILHYISYNRVSQTSRTTQVFLVFHHDISSHFLHVRS